MVKSLIKKGGVKKVQNVWGKSPIEHLIFEYKLQSMFCIELLSAGLVMGTVKLFVLYLQL